MEGLGRLFDIGVGAAPVDFNTANGATGKRIAARDASGLTVVVFAGAAASGTDDMTITIQNHTASTGGTTATAADAVSAAYVKSETALDNDESWVALTPASGVVTLAGATYAATQKIVVVEVDLKKLGTVTDSSFTHVSANVASGSTDAAQLGGVLYVLHGLVSGRAPTSLGNLLNPGAANAS